VINLACGAGLWYNKDRILLCLRDVSPPLRRVTYQRLRRYATMDTLYPHDQNDNPLLTTIPLNLGKVTIVDSEDADLGQVKWFVGNRLYARRKIQVNKESSVLSLHRIILERKLGRPLEDGMITDHINGNTLDNRRSNLREVTQAQNLINKKVASHNTSQYKGVRHLKESNRWEARIGQGSQETLGYFDTAEDASFAYDKAALERYGDLARLNHPVEQVLTWVPPLRMLRKTNTSGFKGVRKHNNKWVARIKQDYQEKHLGSFNTVEEAARAYDVAALKTYGETAKLNFPKEDYRSA
jgi:hypothetical protein